MKRTYDLVLTSRGPNPINLMKVLRQLAGDMGKYSTIPGSLKDAKDFVDAVRDSGPRVFLVGVGKKVAEDVARQLYQTGAASVVTLNG